MECYRTGPETERLQHRAMTEDDADFLFALNNNPEVMRYSGEDFLPSLEIARQAIANYPDFETVGYGRWACVLKETQTVIGFCGLKYLTDLNEVDVGFRFLPEYWGQGYATEASVASLKFGFDTIGLKEIIGLVMPANTASIRVLEKSGMQSEGDFIYDGIPVIRYAKRRE